MSQDTIEGYVDHIIFRNEDNGYTVLNLMVNGSEQLRMKFVTGHGVNSN